MDAYTEAFCFSYTTVNWCFMNNHITPKEVKI